MNPNSSRLPTTVSSRKPPYTQTPAIRHRRIHRLRLFSAAILHCLWLSVMISGYSTPSPAIRHRLHRLRPSANVSGYPSNFLRHCNRRCFHFPHLAPKSEVFLGQIVLFNCFDICYYRLIVHLCCQLVIIM